jgi:hypothetical protein
VGEFSPKHDLPIESNHKKRIIMKCHDVAYEIFGDDRQTVEVKLDPGETVIAEAGTMNWGFQQRGKFCPWWNRQNAG